MPPSPASLRAIPSVDRLLATEGAARLLRTYARSYVVELIRTEVEAVRQAVRRGEPWGDLEAIMRRVEERIRQEALGSLRPVINASGVIVHTNLGRAELAPEAIEAVVAASRGVNLEFDLERGERGRRDAHVAVDLCALTGAEAATVVNNNAAAVLITLNTLADGREVVVSRGELVEIGGSFRIPEVLAKSGARLREVGTTNRTHRRDYEAAVGPDTGVLLKVHTSNYRVVGFTSEVPLDELVEIGRQRGVPVVEDLGSGALIDLSIHGLPKEPVVAERVAMGADVVTFSGDKLLGGPQAGLIVGRQAVIEAINKNPLKRALRCDKLTLAALSATLRLYRQCPALPRHLPTLRWLTRPLEEIESVAREAVGVLGRVLGPDYRLEVQADRSEAGSGALPTETIETRVIAVTHPRLGANQIAALFRAATPPLIGRIREDRFLIDLRAVAAAEDLAVRLAPA